MKTVVVLSGGMDSATALGYSLALGDEVLGTLTFNYGSKHNARENACAAALAKHYKVPNHLVCMPFVNELFKSDLLQSGGEVPEGHYEDANMKRTVVPMRNGIMLAIAAGYAESVGAEGIVIGNHAGDHAIYPDCRGEFMVALSDAFRLGTYTGVTIRRPFEKLTKGQIIERGMSIQVPYHMTWSCYKGGEKHCGRCGTCVERLIAFQEANYIDPVTYLDRRYAFTVQAPKPS